MIFLKIPYVISFACTETHLCDDFWDASHVKNSLETSKIIWFAAEFRRTLMILLDGYLLWLLPLQVLSKPQNKKFNLLVHSHRTTTHGHNMTQHCYS